MSAGMADIIAAHNTLAWDHSTGKAQCGDCDTVVGELQGSIEKQEAGLSIHVAEELAKAGYGIIPNVAPEYGAPFRGHDGPSDEPIGHGPVRDPHWWEKSTHVRLVGPWVELKEPQSDAV